VTMLTTMATKRGKRRGRRKNKLNINNKVGKAGIQANPAVRAQAPRVIRPFVADHAITRPKAMLPLR